jgi:hypothetical protein
MSLFYHMERFPAPHKLRMSLFESSIYTPLPLLPPTPLGAKFGSPIGRDLKLFSTPLTTYPHLLASPIASSRYYYSSIDRSQVLWLAF